MVRSMSERATPVAAFAALSASLRGALWMVAASAFFAMMNAVIRYVSAEVHPFEIAFFRNLFGLLFMLPWLAHEGVGVLKTNRHALFALRGLTGLTAMMAWFWALSVMPLAEAVALSFTLPLFATVLAVVVLRETVRLRRWTATIIGFIGAMIILRPGFQEVSYGQLAVLVSTLVMAMTTVIVKTLSRTESPNVIVIYMVIYLTPMSLVPALFVWETPGWISLAWLAALGAFANLAHICLTHAFKAADSSAVMPFDFARLIFVAIIGYVAFNEVADLWTWIGAGVIAASTVYIAHRESRLARVPGTVEVSAREPAR